MKNFNDFVIFVKVVETGGFSSAAGILQMSASHVSRRVRCLEERLGVQLVNRSTRHIALTEAGQAFYKDCARAIATIDVACLTAVGFSDKPHGTLKVHAAVGVGQWLVTEAVLAFKKSYPEMSVDLYVDSDRENLLRDGYDIVIKTSDLSDSSLDCQEFGLVRYVVIVSPQYLNRMGTPKEPKDLARHDCLIQYGRRPAGEWRFIGPQGPYSVKVSGSFRSTSAISLCKAAARGIGIARVPEYVLYDQSYDGELQILFEDCVAAERKLKAFFPRSPHLSAKVRVFLDCLEQVDARRPAPRLAPAAKRKPYVVGS